MKMLCLAVLLSCLQQSTMAAPPKTPQMSTSQYTATYTIAEDSYGCAQNVSKFARFTTCSQGENVKFANTLTFKGQDVPKSKILCGLACTKKNVQGTIDGLTCVGYRQLKHNECQLAMCPATDGLAVPPSFSSPKAKKVKFAQVAVQLGPECFKPLPTSAPTKAYQGTEAPVASCSDGYDGRNTHFHEFQEIKPDKSLCEMVKPKLGSSFKPIVIQNYACSVEACVRRCFYDNNCRYVVYSQKMKTCAVGTKMEVTDDKDNYLAYWSGEYRAFRRNDEIGEPTTPYYGGWCIQFTPDNCNNYPECRWNKGKRGYNVFIQGGTAGGYCGRLKCIVP